MNIRTCVICGTNKDASEFYGTRNSCKLCIRQKSKEYRLNNKQKIIDYRKSHSIQAKKYVNKWYANHKDELQVIRTLNRKNNHESIKEYEKKQRIKHTKHRQEYGKKYREDNKEKCKKWTRLYYYANKEKLNKKALIRHNNKIIHDDYYRFTHYLRGRIKGGFKQYSNTGKTKSCKEYGINFKEIYLKVGPKPIGKYHMDHIIPLCMFNLDNLEHVRLAHLPCNLHWISAEENLQKGDKIVIELFTPELFEIANTIGLNLFPVKD